MFSGRDAYDMLVEKVSKRLCQDMSDESVPELSDTDAESFSIDLAVADEMYFRGIDFCGR